MSFNDLNLMYDILMDRTYDLGKVVNDFVNKPKKEKETKITKQYFLIKRKSPKQKSK